jgi:hypothetical protein
MLNHLDWTETDFEVLAPDAIPATSYKPRGNRAKYDAAYTHWTAELEGSAVAARDCYRVAWRRMAANTGERTLIPAIIPPGATHVDGVFSAGSPGDTMLIPLVAAAAGSLLLDFMTRVVPKGDIRAPQFSRLPLPSFEAVGKYLALRALRLNCVTESYTSLWESLYDNDFNADEWATEAGSLCSQPLSAVGPKWTPNTPLRRAADRRQALLEIDVLIALSVGISIDELAVIYRTQFPVLYGYDKRTDYYDVGGRLVPNKVLSVWRKKADAMSLDERTAAHPSSGATYTYSPPFITLDREADMKSAYSIFLQRFY